MYIYIQNLKSDADPARAAGGGLHVFALHSLHRSTNWQFEEVKGPGPPAHTMLSKLSKITRLGFRYQVGRERVRGRSSSRVEVPLTSCSQHHLLHIRMEGSFFYKFAPVIDKVQGPIEEGRTKLRERPSEFEGLMLGCSSGNVCPFQVSFFW